MKNINNLTEQQISLIFRGLIELPYKEVNDLINYIGNQLLEKPAEEAPKDE
jgi:hypothetical protein